MDDANSIKNRLLNYFRYEQQSIAVTEFDVGWGICDIYAVKKTNYKSTEVEIKVSKSDLKSELNSINRLIDKEKWDKSCNKYRKHMEYLQWLLYKEGNTSPISQVMRYCIPNKFYYCVPRRLAEDAIDTIIRTPYGLLTYKEGSEYSQFNTGIQVIRKAANIHDEKVTDKIIIEVGMRCSAEIIKLREKIKNN